LCIARISSYTFPVAAFVTYVGWRQLSDGGFRLFWQKKIEKLKFTEVEVRELNASLESLDYLASVCEPLVSKENHGKTTPSEYVLAYHQVVNKINRLSGRQLQSRKFTYIDAVKFGDFIFVLRNYRLRVHGFFHKELLLNQAAWIVDHISDEQLRDRCADLLLAGRDYDRAVNQATLVLEDRLRERYAENKKLFGRELVEHVMPESADDAKFRISENKSEYFGYKKIILGIFQAFRNSSHHEIQSMNRVDAARICAFVDVLLVAMGRMPKRESLD
jgi:hypothetical protein